MVSLSDVRAAGHPGDVQTMTVRPPMRSYCGMFRHATVQLRHNACLFHRDTEVRGIMITISTIYLPTYLPTHQSTNQLTHQSTNLPIKPIYPSVNQPIIHQSTNLFINQPNKPSLYPSINQPIYPSIKQPIYLSIYPSIHPPPINQSV